MLAILAALGALWGPTWQGHACDLVEAEMSRLAFETARTVSLEAARHGLEPERQLACALQLSATTRERDEVESTVAELRQRGILRKDLAEVLIADVNWDRWRFESNRQAMASAALMYTSILRRGGVGSLLSIRARAHLQLGGLVDAEATMYAIGVDAREEHDWNLGDGLAEDQLAPFLDLVDLLVPHDFRFMDDTVAFSTQASDLSSPLKSIGSIYTVVLRMCEVLGRIAVLHDPQGNAVAAAACGIMGERVAHGVRSIGAPVRQIPTKLAYVEWFESFAHARYASAIAFVGSRPHRLLRHAANWLSVQQPVESRLPLPVGIANTERGPALVLPLSP